MEDKRGYYAIIPATVRYDKTIPAAAKLLYGEITALCNQYGFCWAENSYFADLYEVSDRTVQTWINKLVGRSYIYRNFVSTEDGKATGERCLSVVPMSSDFMGGRKNLHGGYEEIFMGGMKFSSPIILHNNNTYNNTSINRSVSTPMKSQAFEKPTLEQVQAYCKERNNSVDPQRFIDFYTSNGWKVGRNSMKDWKAAVRTWEKDRDFKVKPTTTRTATPSKYDRAE